MKCQHYNICTKQEPLCYYSKCKINVDIFKKEDEIRIEAIQQMFKEWKLKKEK